MQISQYRVLSIGFEAEILAGLRSAFDVRCAIAEDASAEVNWHALYSMQLETHSPQMTPEMTACFNAVKQHYLKFSDINSRRFYYVNAPQSVTYNAFVLSFYYCYKLIKQHDINLVLHANVPHEGFDFIIYQIACFLNINTLMCYQSIFANRFFIADRVENFGLLKNTPNLYEKESSNYELPKTWFYMAGSDKDAAYSLKKLLIEVLRKPYRLPPALVRYAYAYQFRKQVSALTSKPVKGEQYVYFPLHLQPELTTSAFGGDYADQVLAVELLSTLLPAGVWIYLKENPKQTEKQRDPFFYKRLSVLQNVRLLSREESSSALIEGSIGVATITGTAGWEALFYGKAVLVFGYAWYGDFSGVVRYGPTFNFNDFIQTAVPSSAYLVDELDNCIQKTGKGVIDTSYQSLVKDFNAEINAQFVCQSIKRFIQSNLLFSQKV